MRPRKLCVTGNNGLYHISNNMFNKIRLYGYFSYLYGKGLGYDCIFGTRYTCIGGCHDRL